MTDPRAYVRFVKVAGWIGFRLVVTETIPNVLAECAVNGQDARREMLGYVVKDIESPTYLLSMTNNVDVKLKIGTSEVIMYSWDDVVTYEHCSSVDPADSILKPFCDMMY